MQCEFRCLYCLSICYPSIFEESKSQHTAEVQFPGQSTTHPLVLLHNTVNVGRTVILCSQGDFTVKMLTRRTNTYTNGSITECIDVTMVMTPHAGSGPRSRSSCFCCLRAARISVTIRRQKLQDMQLLSSLPLTQHGLSSRLLQQLLGVSGRNPLGSGRGDLVDDALLEQFMEHQIVLQ